MSEPTGDRALAKRMLELFQQESSAELDLIAAALDGGRSGTVDVDVVFRAFHTLCGSAAMNGLDQIVELASVFEERFDRLRREPLASDADALALTAAGVALLRRLLVTQGVAGVELRAEIDALLDHLSCSASAAQSEAVSSADCCEAASVQQLFHLLFEPSEQLMRRGVDVLALLEELTGLGELVLVPELDRLPALDALLPDSVYLSWQMLLLTSASAEEVQDVFIFVAADSRLSVQALPLSRPLDTDWVLRARALLLRQPALQAEQLAQELGQRASVPEAGWRGAGELPALLSVDQFSAAEVIPVPVQRLHRQIDLVGELVIAQSSLIQLAASLQHPQLSSAVEQVIRLTSDMRDNAMQLRMVPVGTLFADLAQVVADCAERLGRPLAFSARGADTELDMPVLQALRSPVMTLLRGCAEQGMDIAEERVRLGKPVTGQLALAVEKVGAEVWLLVSDDGTGSPVVELETVRAAVQALRGSCEVTLLPGQGSQHRLRLPLAQDIIDSLLVSVGDSTFVLPLAQVKEVVNLRTARGGGGHGQDILNLRGQLLPFVRLSRLFELDQGADAQDGQVIVVSGGELQAGLLVDRVIGQQQTVIKGVPPLYGEDPALSGATILGDGTVALILDVVALLRQTETELRMPPDGH